MVTKTRVMAMEIEKSKETQTICGQLEPTVFTDRCSGYRR